MRNFIRVLIIIVTLAAGAAGCSSQDKATATGAVGNVNAACQRVRDANEKIASLNLDQKGADFMKDPRVNDLLKESSEATTDLAKKVDAAATKDQGRIGQLRKTFEKYSN